MSALSFFHQTLAFIDGVGGLEVIMILVVSLLLFGGKGMPNMARTIGKTMREFKKATSGIEDEIKRAMNDDPQPAPKAKPPAVLTSPPVAITEAAKKPASSSPSAPAPESTQTSSLSEPAPSSDQVASPTTPDPAPTTPASPPKPSSDA